MTQASIELHEVRDESGVLYRHHIIRTVGATADEARGLAQSLMDTLRGDRRAYLRRKPNAVSSAAEYGADVENEFFRGFCRFSICPEVAGDWEVLVEPKNFGLGDLA